MEHLITLEVPDLRLIKMLKISFSETGMSATKLLLKRLQVPLGRDASEFQLYQPSQSRPGLIDLLDDKKTLAESLVQPNSTLYLKCKGTYAGPKGEFNRNRGPIFGIPLEDATKLAGGGLSYPVLIEKVIQAIEYRDNGMETEGIFRLSGAASQIANLKERFDHGEDVRLEEVNDLHVIAGLLKLYLRELPEPLLTFDLYNVLVAAQHTIAQEKRNAYYRAAILSLPKQNLALLTRLCGFLHELSLKASLNKMALENLATVFGPNILRRQGESVMDMVRNTAAVNSITNDLMKYYSTIFEDCTNVYLGFGTALYSYTPQNATELALAENDVVFVTRTDSNDGWWDGENCGRFGAFPQSYLQMMKYLKPTISSLSSQHFATSQRSSTISNSDYQRLQDMLKKESTQRKEAESVVALLANSFEELKRKVTALESANDSLKKEVQRLQTILSKPASSS